MRRIGCLGVLLLLSCTGSAGGGSAPSTSGPTDAPPRTFVRTCESSVYGDLGPGWRRDEVAAGPVVFVAASGYANDPPRWFSATGDRATSHKVLIVILGDAAAEVSVDHPDAALAYDPRRWGGRNRMRFEAGDARVRFEPCSGQRSTQFNGAFLLRGPNCVPVEVEVEVEGGTPAFATLSFGAGDCR